MKKEMYLISSLSKDGSKMVPHCGYNAAGPEEAIAKFRETVGNTAYAELHMMNNRMLSLVATK